MGLLLLLTMMCYWSDTRWNGKNIICAHTHTHTHLEPNGKKQRTTTTRQRQSPTGHTNKNATLSSLLFLLPQGVFEVLVAALFFFVFANTNLSARIFTLPGWVIEEAARPVARSAEISFTISLKTFRVRTFDGCFTTSVFSFDFVFHCTVGRVLRTRANDTVLWNPQKFKHGGNSIEKTMIF